MYKLIKSGGLSLLLILGVAFINGIMFQGTRGIYETTEGRYSECARETLLSGNLSEPILNGKPHWTKPPLTYLAIIASMRTFGTSPWGLRAFLVPSLMLAVAAVWWIGVLIWGSRAGFWAGIVMATSPFVVSIANIVATDMLVTLWAALAMAAFWHARTQQSQQAERLMWLFLALGFLTKGPPALLVPIVLILCATLLLKNNNTWRPSLLTHLTGIMIFILVGFGWYLWKVWQHPGLGAYWIGHEVIDRNLSDELKRNPGFGYVFTNYIPILLFGSGPWLALVLVRGWGERGRLRLLNLATCTWREVAPWALLGSILLPFIVFSLSHSKLPMYLAPLFVPLSLLIGRGVDVLIHQNRLQWRTAAIIGVVMILLIVTGKAASAFPERVRDMTRLANRLTPILSQEHPTALYIVNKRPVNGLEFHLQRKLEAISPETLGDHMLKTITPDTHPLYVSKKKDWEPIATNMPCKVRVEPIGPYWVGIWPAK